MTDIPKRVRPVLTDIPGSIGLTRSKLGVDVCFHKSHHFFISTGVKPSHKMTKNSVRRPRSSKKTHHYRPQVVNLRDIVKPKPRTVTPRIIYVQNPYYEQMESGLKTVEARPNYPCLRDLVPGTLVQFSNRYSGRSFLVTITTRRVHRDFATMLRAETIKDCLPDRDPHDLQRAVNVYHGFRNQTYKFIARKHGSGVFTFRTCRTSETQT